MIFPRFGGGIFPTICTRIYKSDALWIYMKNKFIFLFQNFMCSSLLLEFSSNICMMMLLYVYVMLCHTVILSIIVCIYGYNFIVPYSVSLFKLYLVILVQLKEFLHILLLSRKIFNFRLLLFTHFMRYLKKIVKYNKVLK